MATARIDDAPEAMAVPVEAALAGTVMGKRIAARDWSAHPMGAPHRWPGTFVTALALVLRSRQPMFLAWGPELHFFYNEDYRAILGARDSTALALPFRQVWPEVWQTVQPFIARNLAGEAIWAENFFTVLERNGFEEESWHSFSYSPVLGGDGRPAGILCSCVETTGQVIAERRSQSAVETARLRAEELATVLDAVPAAIWVARDPQCETITGNRLSAELLRLPDEADNMSKTAPDTASTAHFEIVDMRGQPIAPGELPVQRAARGEVITDFEERVAFDDGTWLDLLGNAAPLLTLDGKVRGAVAAFIDITSRKQAESDLRQLNVTLEQRVQEALADREKALAQLHEARKHETIGQLTSGVAHDFNNLLTPLLGAIEIAQRRLPADDRAQRLLTGAMQAGERARTLIQRLLAFGRRQHLAAVSIDPAQVIESMRDLIRHSVGPKVAVEIVAEAGLPAVLVDPNQLELAILNLAVNARDAMPGGGILRLRAELDADAPVAERMAVLLSVEDSGMGMDAATMERATEPFFTTKQPGEGTGLGLSMVAGLAGQSGGHLQIESAVGAGTSVRLWLPLSGEPPVGRATELPARDGPCGPGFRILLVDDEPLVREGTAAMLEETGHVVAQAAGAAEALAALRSGFLADLVITDYAMPGMTGAQLVAALPGALPQGYACPPALLITGFADLADEAAAALPRLAKPFGAGELLAQVHRLVSARTS